MNMPRQRMIKPEFFDSESLSMCSFAARLAFIGLWVMGDDYGNGKFEPHRLRCKIFPMDDGMDDSTFCELLEELEQTGCVKAYEIDGERYLSVPNFATYQTVKRPSKTNIPEPPKSTVGKRFTALVQQWGSSGGAVGEQWDTHPLVDHLAPTAHPKEVKKEGSSCCFTTTTTPACNTDMRSSGAAAADAAPTERQGDRSTDAATSTQGACPECGSVTYRKTDQSGTVGWYCPRCHEVKKSVVGECAPCPDELRKAVMS